MAFVDDLARRLVTAGLAGAPGYALLIDYGGAGEAGGPVHGYAGHRIVDDVLDDPGGTDITAGVDLALLATRADAQGAVAFGDVTQRAALGALGFDDWFRAELASQHRQLEDGDGVGAVRTWSAKSRASLLADPGGLGRFRWLLLASPGLAAPPWWDRATDQ
jgi:SAM-dependent MidA family methyltransferase